jgi:signal transduction histidine kinase
VEHLLVEGDAPAPALRIGARDRSERDGIEDVAIDIADMAPGRSEAAETTAGLALCRRIIEAHGGVVETGAREGARAFVTLRFPALAD